MMNDKWSLKMSDDGWIELTVGANNRRTIGFHAAEGARLAQDLARFVDFAGRLQSERAKDRLIDGVIDDLDPKKEEPS